jgi:hypothetical protein
MRDGPNCVWPQRSWLGTNHLSESKAHSLIGITSKAMLVWWISGVDLLPTFLLDLETCQCCDLEKPKKFVSHRYNRSVSSMTVVRGLKEAKQVQTCQTVQPGGGLASEKWRSLATVSRGTLKNVVLQCFDEQCSPLLQYPISLHWLPSPILSLLLRVTVRRCLHRAEVSGSWSKRFIFRHAHRSHSMESVSADARSKAAR